MEYDMNPFRELPTHISPLEFEQFCLETLKAYAIEESLRNFEIKHNQKVETHDSTYQIDVPAEYTALGCKNTKHRSTEGYPYFNERFPVRRSKIC